MDSPNDQKSVTIMKDLSGYLKEDQIKKMFYACDLLRDKVLIRLLWKSGRRISEILQLKVKDIDFDEHRILWNILKKGRDHHAWKYCDTKTLELLKYYIELSKLKEDFYILHGGHADKKPISRQRAFQIVRRVGKKVNIIKVGTKTLHPHHFRHSFSIIMAKKLKTTEDLLQLQNHLEHSSLAMTETYLQFGDFKLKELLED